MHIAGCVLVYWDLPREVVCVRAGLMTYTDFIGQQSVQKIGIVSQHIFIIDHMLMWETGYLHYWPHVDVGDWLSSLLTTCRFVGDWLSSLVTTCWCGRLAIFTADRMLILGDWLSSLLTAGWRGWLFFFIGWDFIDCTATGLRNYHHYGQTWRKSLWVLL